MFGLHSGSDGWPGGVPQPAGPGGYAHRRQWPEVVRRERQGDQSPANSGTGQPRTEPSWSPPRRRGRSAGGCSRGLTGRGGRHDGLLPGTSRTDRHAIRAGAATVQRVSVPGGADRSPARKTGKGPNRPSDRPRPAGCRIEGRCLLGGRALPVSHPRWLPAAQATAAVGPGTRTALAHCAVPGPKSATVAEGDSSWVSCGGRRYLGGATPCCQLPPDLHRCAKVQVGDVTPDQTISLCGQRFRRVGPDALPADHPNGPLTGKARVRLRSQPAPRRCPRRSPRRPAGRARPRPTGRPSHPPSRRPPRGRRPGRAGPARGSGCRPG